ncbi:MAG: glutamate--cysteine ligase [Deltaproteobacteria bacterium]|nr:glutamate--cysteine ligase [Deltaproteobacteria bacterium]
MIVDGETLSVLPVTDEILRSVAGEYTSEVEVQELCWSNELVLHVIELKTNGPVVNLEGLPETFNEHVSMVNSLLAPMGGRLMPTSMHPWMDPGREMKLWPHDDSVIYETFHRIFDCRGHGWANLQCSHLNLPFADDEEFARLHAAIRLILPIIPAIAASSPMIEMKVTGLLDNRLDVYRKNARQVPSITGRVVPEPVFSRKDYENEILDSIYRDMAPHDPEGLLAFEWVNARGAIARFERKTIEIRIVDIQECPLADLAILAAIIEVIKNLVEGRWCDLDSQMSWSTKPLEAIMLDTMKDAEAAVISDRAYLESLGFTLSSRCSAGELWHHLAETIFSRDNESRTLWEHPLRTIIDKGSLARRIINAHGGNFSFERTREIYARLCESLDTGRMFSGEI